MCFLLCFHLIPKPLNDLYSKLLKQNRQQQRQEWCDHLDSFLLCPRWIIRRHHRVKLLNRCGQMLSFFSPLWISLCRPDVISPEHPFFASKVQARLSKGCFVDTHSNSILISAHGHTENSSLSRYCLTTLTELSGPGVDTLTGSANLHST
jgi:hypothetical protein